MAGVVVGVSINSDFYNRNSCYRNVRYDSAAWVIIKIYLNVSTKVRSGIDKNSSNENPPV